MDLVRRKKKDRILLRLFTSCDSLDIAVSMIEEVMIGYSANSSGGPRDLRPTGCFEDAV